MIEATICSPDVDIGEHWEDLVNRVAFANVFMHPVALKAAAATRFAKVRVLLAWSHAPAGKKLVGLWAFQAGKIAHLWPAILAAPPYEYAFVSGPVIDPAFAEEVIPAFFQAIAGNAALPNVIRIKYLDGESEAYNVIMKALATGKNQHLTISERPRPFVSRDSGLKRSGSTRKKLRQDWNRLSAIGAVDVVTDRTETAVREAFETFLVLEANSWKGDEGTALLCNDKDVAFARRLVGDLAAQQSAAVALLRVDGRPVAAQVLLYCGRVAYTWKTAFHADYAKYSPGALLVDKVTDQLFSGGEVEAIESCSPDGSFMNQLWAGRRTTIDLLLDVGVGRSPSFGVVALCGRGYLLLRDLRNKWRARPWSLLPPRRHLLPSR